ncbi:hypothetical protein GDO86_004543 [Hymenochirus boettgeri]|uniref:Cytoskeleton-associated protein 2 C-terminal domain-containing protein n=2 Tax=Hymenochirus boettgeri TaxID=247094 RepID=A0A8T2K883_9PIPI|nr:hypothetical protein GDO86_004543 [Hymenochirus boettgeri]KAG8452788.1 hypothetical protein GDO86_004543 [Hymenochirus boettgeri]
MAQPLVMSRRLQPEYKEQRRKKMEEHLSRKMSNSTSNQANGPTEMRSLMKSAMQNLPQNRTRCTKPYEKKQADKENTSMPKDLTKNAYQNARSKTDCAMREKSSDKSVRTDQRRGPSLSQTFLKTKSLTKKQLIEPLNPDSAKPISQRPVLGTYRGKTVQSKIDSFRKTSASTDGPNPKMVQKPSGLFPVTTKTITGAGKNVTKLISAGVIDQKKTSSTQTRTQVKSSKGVPFQNKTEPTISKRESGAVIQRKPVEKTLPNRSAADKNISRGSSGQKAPVISKGRVQASTLKTLPGPRHCEPAKPPVAKVECSRPRETAEERKARLAKWRQEKGRTMKRPSIAPIMVPTSYEPKREPDPQPVSTEPKSDSEKATREPRQFFWATMAEEDEQELFTLKVHQVFSECHKLIDEGCPREEVLDILSKQIQCLPEAKKLSKYWECLARLEQRQGEVGKVIAICEEAAAAGAQPLDELRTILADALENLKSSSEGNDKPKMEEIKKEKDSEIERKSETELRIVKEQKVRVRGVKKGLVKQEMSAALMEETKDPTDRPLTPEHKDSATVIRFNVRSTPHLQKMKTKLQLDENDVTFKDLKFLTPVRRSRRLERKSQCLPDMLRDHDPCVSGIAQLEDLENSTNAYIFRKNTALKEVSATTVSMP